MAARHSLTFAAAIAAAALAAGTSLAEDVQVLSRGKWKKHQARTVAELKGFATPKSDERNEFGGWRGRPRVARSGFFRRRKVGGRWWLIDPDGRRFLSVGVNSINLKDVDRGQQGGGEWAQEAADLLREHGFNTLGCWSEWQAFHKVDETRLPYTPRWNFMATYKAQRPAANGPSGYPHETMPVFDAEFEQFCTKHAERLKKTREDPWLLGHFSDNELPFRPNALDNYLALGTQDPGRKAAARWWEKRVRGRSRAITTRDRNAFLELVAKRYYRIVSKAIKANDPNHLFLGSRIHGRTIRPALFRAAKGLVDVMSINYYHRWSAEHERMDRWVDAFDGPFLITEWYAQSVKSAKTPATGAGFRVQTNAARGRFYQNLALGLLEHPGCVGWHWFKYGGDGDGFRKGIVDRSRKPHRELLGRMGQLNRRAYALARFFVDR
ncbi:MAG: hypothetical protein JKY65_14745 [Planctomycetes bacterium]|nr:hypothetical protein [Planctomycetota bacterium]